MTITPLKAAFKAGHIDAMTLLLLNGARDSEYDLFISWMDIHIPMYNKKNIFPYRDMREFIDLMGYDDIRRCANCYIEYIRADFKRHNMNPDYLVDALEIKIELDAPYGMEKCEGFDRIIGLMAANWYFTIPPSFTRLLDLMHMYGIEHWLTDGCREGTTINSRFEWVMTKAGHTWPYVYDPSRTKRRLNGK